MPPKSAPRVLSLADANGTLMTDCLLLGADKDELRQLDDFSNSAAHPAQIIAGYTIQVLTPPYLCHPHAHARHPLVHI